MKEGIGLKGLKGKNERGIGLKLRISCVERYIKDIYLMFLSRESDIKLCQNYTKIHVFTILHKNSRFK